MPTTLACCGLCVEAPMTADLMPAVQSAVRTRVRKPAIQYCRL